MRRFSRAFTCGANVINPVSGGNNRIKCLMKARREPGLDLTTTEMPSFGPADVLIKITSTSICGTDLHIYKWDEWSQATIPVPMVTGHEFAGVVVAVGAAAKGETQHHLKEGDRVTGEGHITCGVCRNCRAGQRHLCRNTVGIGVTRTGAFAEYMALPAVNTFKLPDAITDRIASSMDPLGNAVHTALSFNLVGEDVLITGAGPIGCMAAGICKFVGARHVVVTDVNPYRLELAKQCGADVTVNTSGEHALEQIQQTMADLGMCEGFDVGLEMSGNQTAINQMIRTMNNGGKIALLGIPSDKITINWNDVVFKGLILKGIYGREMFETWYKMRNLLIAGLDKTLAPIWSHTFPIDDYEKGFKEMQQGSCGKVELRWK